LRSVESGGNDVGYYSSLALRMGTNPVIAYYDFTNGDLRLAICVDPTCSL
jgi:hypothetical protein